MTCRTKLNRIRRTAPILITGGAGFIGCNLAERLASAGEDVLILDNLSREGAAQNLADLRAHHAAHISHIDADVADPAAREAVANASAVVHLAAQVAVTTSLANPEADFRTNAVGTLNMLEAVRRRGSPIPFLFASTNKVYGDLAHLALTLDGSRWAPRDPSVAALGLDEATPLAFRTPYGCSKGAADQYVLDYAASFDVPAAAFRMSCIYGDRQHGTEEQGWTAHLLKCALENREIVIFGDGRQVRDILYVVDATEAYVRALGAIGKLKGRAWNLGGGPANAVTLEDVLHQAETMLHRPVARRYEPWRPGDQRYYVSNARALTEALDLPPPLTWTKGLALLAHWLIESGTLGPAGGGKMSPRELAL